MQIYSVFSSTDPVYIVRGIKNMAGSKVRIFNLKTATTLQISNDEFVDFKTLPIDTATPTATVFGEHSEIMNIDWVTTTELRFVVRVKDSASEGSYKELKIFRMKLSRDTTNNKWKFEPLDKTVLTIAKGNLGKLSTAQVLYYADKSDSTQTLDGFFVVTSEKITYFTYKLTDGNWNLKQKFFRDLRCQSTDLAVNSATPIATLGYNVHPQNLNMFIKYGSQNEASYDTKAYANYNLLLNRYSCETTKNTNMENQVSFQKVVTFDNENKIKHYRIANSAYLKINYDAMTKGKQEDYSFDVSNIYNSAEKETFTIKGIAYEEFSKAKLAEPPLSKMKAYAEEWVTLPFRSHNLGANNPTIELKIGDTMVDDKSKRISYNNALQFKSKLPNHTSATTSTKTYIDKDATDFFAADGNTFVAVQSLPG